VAACLAGSVAAQSTETLPDALAQMVKTEQAFAAHAKQVRWKQAFLDYFGDAAVGFDEGKVGSAKEQIRQAPDPPPDHQLLWEPRFGDVAGSGEIGYLTGPSRSILPSRDNGRPRHSVYASVWKRQRDGEFRVVLDVGVPTPGPAAFAAGFVRAPHADRFTGDYDDTTPPLSAADGVLNSVIRTDLAKAYSGRLAPGVRFHRPNALPIVGEAAVAKWLAAQPAWATADSVFAESARSGDIGYSWGTYTMRARGKTPAPYGFYVRVWARERSGQWKVALDILQPQ
jgi:ketosteroid isomerase-like protein